MMNIIICKKRIIKTTILEFISYVFLMGILILIPFRNSNLQNSYLDENLFFSKNEQYLAVSGNFMTSKGHTLYLLIDIAIMKPLLNEYHLENPVKECYRNLCSDFDHNSEIDCKSTPLYSVGLSAGDRVYLFYKDLIIIDTIKDKKSKVELPKNAWPYNISNDGNKAVWLLSKNDKQFAQIYDAKTHQIVSTIPLDSYGNGVISFAISNEANLLAVGYQRKTNIQPKIEFYDINTQKNVYTIKMKYIPLK